MKLDYSTLSKVELLKLNDEYIDSIYQNKKRLNQLEADLAQKNNVDLANIYKLDLQSPQNLVEEIEAIKHLILAQIQEKDKIILEYRNRK